MSEQVTAADLLEQLIGKVGEAELYELRSCELPVRFHGGALGSLRSVETAGRALRVIQDGRLGFSTTTDLTDSTTLVQNALASAQFGDPAAFEFTAQRSLSPVKCFDPQIEQLDEKQLIVLGKEVIERIKAYDVKLQVDVWVSKRVEHVRLLTTKGLALEDRRTALSLTLVVTQTQEDDVWILGKPTFSRRLQDLDSLALAEWVIDRLRWGERIVSIESRQMPVVFRSYGTLVLLWPFVLGLNGRQVLIQASPLGEKLGQQAFSPQFTLVDDGRLDFASRSAPFDDEGTPTTTKPLVEGGILRRFLYDLQTAAQVGVQSTGNGFKISGFLENSFQSRPSVAPTSWLVSPGEQNLEQLLSGLDEALLVEDVLGLGQGNIIAGDFSNNVHVGFLVRQGEIVGRVKDTMIAGNTYTLLKENLIALGNHPEWVHGFLYTPAIAVDGVSVVSKH